MRSKTPTSFHQIGSLCLCYHITALQNLSNRKLTIYRSKSLAQKQKCPFLSSTQYNNYVDKGASDDSLNKSAWVTATKYYSNGCMFIIHMFYEYSIRFTISSNLSSWWRWWTTKIIDLTLLFTAVSFCSDFGISSFIWVIFHPSQGENILYYTLSLIFKPLFFVDST